MNKRGFTLVEMIGAVIILGIIAIIAIPVFTKNIESFRDDYYENMTKNLVSAGKEFFQDNRNILPRDYLESSKVSIATLKSERYIDKIDDYEGNTCSSESYVIVIKKGKDNYEYSLCLRCDGDEFVDIDKDQCRWPDNGISIELGTPPNTYIYKGTPRSELKEALKISPQIVKYDINGNEIARVSGEGSDNVSYIYPTNIDKVDPNVPGVYEVEYNYKGEIRTGAVTVYEYNAPVISMTKTNKVIKSINLSTKTAVTENITSTYYGNGDWAQSITVVFSLDDVVKYSNLGTSIEKIQVYENGSWSDFCKNITGNTCSVTFNTETNRTLKFRALDKKGNISLTSKTVYLKIDKTPPSCAINSGSPNGKNSWFTKDVYISFTSIPVDSSSLSSYSGLDYYYVTTGELRGEQSAIHTSETAGITWFGVVADKAQNVTVCSTSFKLDKSIPLCTNSGDNSSWKKGSVTLTYGGSDNISGVSFVNGASGSSATKTYSSTMRTADVPEYTIENGAGLSVKCPSRSASIYLDNTPPTCTNSGDNTNWKNSSVTINYGCSDSDSGCNSSYSGGSKVFSSGTVKTTSIGSYEIRDLAGNSTTCASRTASVYADFDKPTCTVSKDIVGSTSGVNVTITCKDGTVYNDANHSGVSDCAGKGVVGSTTVSGLVSTTIYNVSDNAGNKNTCSVTITPQVQRRSKSCSSCSRCSAGGCETRNRCEAAGCSTWSGWSNSCEFSDISSSSNSQVVSCTFNTSTCNNTGGASYECGTKTCTLYNRGSACTCYEYKRNCSNCGCESWGSFGGWSNVASCSAGDSSDHMTYYECQTVYN